MKSFYITRENCVNSSSKPHSQKICFKLGMLFSLSQIIGYRIVNFYNFFTGKSLLYGNYKTIYPIAEISNDRTLIGTSTKVNWRPGSCNDSSYIIDLIS